jgi:hypothetical protein
VSAITISEAYAKKKDAEIKFSEDYLECCRCNNTTRKMKCYDDILDIYQYETYSGETITYRLREIELK